MSLPLSKLGLAVRALEVLVEYRANMAKLREDPAAMDVYLEVGNELDQLRVLSSVDPRLSVPMVQLLIAHTELVAGIWKQGRNQTRARAWMMHGEACEFMHGRCMELVGRLQ